VVAQFVEHHITQMIQRFPKLYRIDQGTTGPIVAVVAGQVRAGDQECGNAPAVGSDLYSIQPSAHAQQKRTLEQIGDFNGTFQRDLTSFQLIDLRVALQGEMR
jgi:hypothetical protein